LAQEIETALREHIPLTVLIWQDDAYGLIKWKMDLELGHDVAVGFSNPDFVAYAESFGARGYQVRTAGDLLPILIEALAADTVSVIACRWTMRRTSGSPMPSASCPGRSDRHDRAKPCCERSGHPRRSPHYSRRPLRGARGRPLQQRRCSVQPCSHDRIGALVSTSRSSTSPMVRSRPMGSGRGKWAWIR
jgi:hypothetical protein